MLRSGMSAPDISKKLFARSGYKDQKTLMQNICRWRREISGIAKRLPSEEKIVYQSGLTSDESQLLEKYREQKSLLAEECKQAGIDVEEVKHYWYKSKLFSIFAKPNEKSLDDLKNEIAKKMSEHSPSYRKIVRKPLKTKNCLVIDPADVHIGKLAREYQTGDKYDSNTAVKRVINGVEGLLATVSPFSFDKIVLIIGNDILHTDNTRRTTTSGTAQDTDGMWFDNFLTAQKMYVDIIEMLMQIADVHIMHNVSNHDEMTGWCLAQCIQGWFRKCSNVSFDTTMRHRKAFLYHDNLIGTTHGDGAKKQDLPILLAQEFPKEWAVSRFRTVYVHHTHHKESKDYVGVTVETSRSLSGADAWHSKMGYQHAPKAIECYLHGKGVGQFGRFTHYF